MFASIYDSPLHVPVVPWLVAAMVLVGAARSRGFLRAFLALFAVEIAADAWLTGPWSPLAPDSAAATACGIAFVILGDLRFFALAARAWSGRLDAKAAGAAFALSLVVPILAQALRAAWPAVAADLRRTFLVYEVLFFVLAAVLGALLPRAFRARPPGARRLARRLVAFELVQYALWAAADVVLLWAHADVGFLLRLIPNLMYYALFLPFALWASRAAEREDARP